MEEPERQYANESSPNYSDYDPFKELAEDDSFEHLPIIILECLIFIAEDIETFEVNQFSQGKKGGIIEIIAEDSTRPRQHASNDRITHSMRVPGLINGNR